MEEINWNFDENPIMIGNYELDPDVYEDVQVYKNATVIVSKNTRTGELVCSWKRQPNTTLEWEKNEEI